MIEYRVGRVWRFSLLIYVGLVAEILKSEQLNTVQCLHLLLHQILFKVILHNNV